MDKSYTMFISGSLAIALFVIIFLIGRPVPTLGSVSVTDEYMATSTAPSSIYGATVSSTRVIREGQGALGSFVVTGANTGIINFYDATTTSVLKRTGNTATSTILLASIPASLAAGTYTFDVAYRTALLIEITGSAPTSTVTYR